MLELLIIWRAREWSPLRIAVSLSVVLALAFVVYKYFLMVL